MFIIRHDNIISDIRIIIKKQDFYVMVTQEMLKKLSDLQIEHRYVVLND